MLRLLRWLFTGDGHSHKWVRIGTNKVYAEDYPEIPIAVVVTQECEHCGKIKTFKIKN